MQQSIVLNSEKLRSVSHASHTAEVTITALAIRERLRHFSDITRTRNTLIRKGEKIVDADYISFWKGLQEAGVGVIVYGRKGKPDRFEWHYSMKKVAEAALEGKDVVAERVGGISHAELAKPAPKPVAKPVRKLAKQVKRAPFKAAPATVTQLKERFIYIPLRKDFNLELTVPGNLSKEEIETISNALKRLSA